MEIVYKLNDREKEFMVALSTKEGTKNQWSGRMVDDKFNKEWDIEKRSILDAGLANKKDGGTEYEYWRYGLTAKGIEIQQQILKEISNDTN